MSEILFSPGMVRSIVRRFGGSPTLAGKLAIPSRSTIDNWPIDGLPPRWHLRLLALAKTEGVELSHGELEEATKRKKPIIIHPLAGELEQSKV